MNLLAGLTGLSARPRGLWFVSVVVILWLLAPSIRGADTDVIINEIMYHPPNDLDDLQFVELFNRGEASVDISNWSFTKGIKFTFLEGTKIDAGSFLTVCRNRNDFGAHYGKDMTAFGDFSGSLSHKGDRIELSNAQKKVVDAVRYSDRGDWPIGADGYSSSLERIYPHASGEGPENWAPSRLPPAKRPAGTPGRKNDNFAGNLPPIVSKVEFAPRVPALGQSVSVTASVADADDIQSVSLHYRTVAGRSVTAEKVIPMNRISGDGKSGRYSAAIEAHSAGQLVRFRIKALDGLGIERFHPSENEPRPTYSYATPAVANDARIPFGFVIQAGPAEQPGASIYTGSRGRQSSGAPTRGNGAFIYVPPQGGQAEVFDHVRITPRHGGFKVRFLKDQPLHGIGVANILFEGAPRWVLSEHLAYELYRRAGVPAPMSEHIRVWKDGRLSGYQLLVEQPNRSFLARNGRDDTGNLYKLLWYGQGLVGQHERKTGLPNGHQDLLQLMNGLNRKRGAEQWEFIQENFNVEEMASYFAVNMCISNWDGFFNNYFTYHDVNGTKKWEIYPWDEDKTWGDYDGASPRYDWYEMPLTFGMAGDRSPTGLGAFFGGGPFGGVSWWRPPGHFSGPLLANPEFRKRFLARLREICTTVFTEEKFGPVIRSLEQKLAPEMTVRPQAGGENSQDASSRFQRHIQSFQAQLSNRRKFILAELDKVKP